MSIEHAIEQVVKIGRSLPALGLATGSTGNISVRDAQSGRIAIKCSGVHYEEMTPRDVAILSPDGTPWQIEAGKKPSFETPTHVAIYQTYPHIMSVIHTHTKFAIILSASMDELPLNTTPTARRLLGRPVPVVDFVENGTQEMADRLVPILKDNLALSIRNHGTFVTGASAQEALDRVVALNDATEVLYYMRLLGTPGVLKNR